jgi:hypothetical protein
MSNFDAEIGFDVFKIYTMGNKKVMFSKNKFARNKMLLLFLQEMEHKF